MSSSGKDMDVNSLMLSIKLFLCHGVTHLQRALNDGFGETVVASHMPEPCKLPSLDSCQKRFLWTHTVS